MPDRVLLTGISGFLGSHIARVLLEAGYVVRGSVRSPSRLAPVQTALAAAGADLSCLEFVTLDLMDERGWTAAAEGCRYLQHVASPVAIRSPRRRDDLVGPAVEGTRRAVTSALAAGVERIVLTSSVAAVVYGHPAARTAPFTAADWTDTAAPNVTAYAESKTRAEQEAWSLVNTAGRPNALAAINPSVILGPLLGYDPGTSAGVIRRLLDGGVPLAPRLNLGIVDVRDVATLHLAAMRSPDAGGQRVLASAGSMTLLEVAEVLANAFPAFARRLPRRHLPDWVVRLYGLLDPAAAAAVTTRSAQRELDCRTAEALLGRSLSTPREAIIATAESLIQHGLVRAPKRG